MSHPNDIFLRAADAKALALMLADPVHTRRAGAGVDELIEVLSCAHIVPAEALGGEVVGMNSQIAYEQLPGGVRRSITLAYPCDADPAAGRISVLSPVGCALLGRKAGSIVDVDLPSGATVRLLIREVRLADRHEESIVEDCRV